MALIARSGAVGEVGGGFRHGVRDAVGVPYR